MSDEITEMFMARNQLDSILSSSHYLLSSSPSTATDAPSPTTYYDPSIDWCPPSLLSQLSLTPPDRVLTCSTTKDVELVRSVLRSASTLGSLTERLVAAAAAGAGAGIGAGAGAGGGGRGEKKKKKK